MDKKQNGADEMWYLFFDLPREQGIVLTFNDYFNSFTN